MSIITIQIFLMRFFSFLLSFALSFHLVHCLFSLTQYILHNTRINFEFGDLNCQLLLHLLNSNIAELLRSTFDLFWISVDI